MKKVFKGKCSPDVEEVKHKKAKAIKVIKIDEFRNYFELREKHLGGCIASNGEHFEGH